MINECVKTKVWGVCYQVQDKTALAKLNEREKRFAQVSLNFFPQDEGRMSTLLLPSSSIIQAVTYVGPENGPLFLGEASIEDMGRQISGAEGPSGSNSEYIFRLADFMRSQFPNVQDDHLFQIEAYLQSMSIVSE